MISLALLIYGVLVFSLVMISREVQSANKVLAADVIEAENQDEVAED